MEISFTGKNLDITDGMRDHCYSKFEKFDRYDSSIVDRHVVLKKENITFHAEVTVAAKQIRAFSDGQSKENIYAAIDQACSRVEVQLKKHREKVTSHYKEHGDNFVAPKVKTAEEMNQPEVAEEQD